MKKFIVFSFISLIIVSKVYASESHIFTDIYRPRMFLVDNKYIYISDQNSVFIYDLNDFKLVKRLLMKGGGPQESIMTPFIAINQDKILINCIYKIVLYSKDFKFIKELRHSVISSEIYPVGNHYAVPTSKNKNEQIFSVFNENFEKIKDFAIEKPSTYSDSNKYIIIPESKISTYGDKIFLSQPSKGFLITVFNQNGNQLYTIKKDIPRVKSEEKHKNREIEKLMDALGKARFNKLRIRDKFAKKSLPDYLPDIKNCWVTDNKIYVKTHDITKTKDKYIILDLKGNILKTLFLPKAYYRKFCFGNNRYYYLREHESEEGCILNIVKL